MVNFFFPKHKNEKCAAGDLQSLCGCALRQPYQCQGRKSRSLIIWGYALFTNSVAGDFQTRDYSPQHMKKNISSLPTRLKTHGLIINTQLFHLLQKN